MNTLIKLRKFFEDEVIKNTMLENFDDDMDLIESGVLDSLAIMALSGFIEQEFSITVESDDIVPENFRSVKTIVRYIEKK